MTASPPPAGSPVPPHAGDPHHPGQVFFPPGHAQPPVSGAPYPQPAAGPGAAGPRNKKSTAVVVLIVGAVVVGVCCVGGGLTALVLPMVKRSVAARQYAQSGAVPATNVPTTDAPATSVPTTDLPDGANPPTVSTTEPAVTAKIGQPARGTTFEFTVTKLKCGVSRVGDNFINSTAQGQFCLVTLTVKNVGGEPERYSSYNQTAVGPDGVQYHDDDQAEFWANSKNNLPFMKDINPGNSETGVLVYDIPKGGKLVSLELFDGASDSLSITLER